jgi:hypothetical protein
MNRESGAKPEKVQDDKGSVRDLRSPRNCFKVPWSNEKPPHFLWNSYTRQFDKCKSCWNPASITISSLWGEWWDRLVYKHDTKLDFLAGPNTIKNLALLFLLRFHMSLWNPCWAPPGSISNMSTWNVLNSYCFEQIMFAYSSQSSIPKVQACPRLCRLTVQFCFRAIVGLVFNVFVPFVGALVLHFIYIF